MNIFVAAIVRVVLPLCVMLPMTGCYVLHVAHGQSQVMAKRRPIPRVIANPRTPPDVKTRLEQVLQIRRFAVQELGLPDNGSYRSYADLHRQYVVWNVFAAREFSVEPEHWCFPVAGCVAYRGYFSENKARAFAAKLARRGLDVFVGGVPAYSTLGHFDDPVLNTMLGWNDVQLAAILFHELSHQLLYVPGDSAFNEAFATVVEDEGVKRWLLRSGRAREFERYGELSRRSTAAARLFVAAREQLSVLYASGEAPQVLREKKQAVLAHLKSDYASFKRSGAGNFGFDAWMVQDLNNAHLASVATYEQCVPGLKALLDEAQGDLQQFYKAARELAKLNPQERHRRACQS